MATTKRLETVAFTIESGTVTKETNGTRTLLRFAAPAERHLDGGFECAGVRALMFDAAGRFVGRRSDESSRRVLANRALWTHEIPTDQLAAATHLKYEIEYRFDYRRKLVGGELPVLPAESDGNDYWPWVTPDPRTLEDRTASIQLALWARTTELAITYGHVPKVVTDNFRCEYEIDLLDADRLVVMSRVFRGELMNAQPNFDDTSLWSIDRRLIRTLKFFEVRVRCESRAIAFLEVDAL